MDLISMKRGLLLAVFILSIYLAGAEIIGYKPIEKQISVPYEASIILLNNSIMQDSYLKTNTIINYLNDSQKRQYTINYLVLDENNNTIIKDTRTAVVEKQINLEKEFYIGMAIDPGMYSLKIEVKHQEYGVSDSKEFSVLKKIGRNYYLRYILYGFVIIAIMVILFLVSVEITKLKNIEKEQPEMIKSIYEEYKKQKSREETLGKLRKQLRLLDEAGSLRIISKDSYEKAVFSIKKLINKIKR